MKKNLAAMRSKKRAPKAATAIEGSNSLADLAARIKAEQEAAGIAFKDSVRHAITAGELLIEAKGKLKHGQWFPWLKEHCTISDRTAQVYMRCARGRSVIEEQIRSGAADLSLNEAVAVLMPRPPTPRQRQNKAARQHAQTEAEWLRKQFDEWERFRDKYEAWLSEPTSPPPPPPAREVMPRSSEQAKFKTPLKSISRLSKYDAPLPMVGDPFTLNEARPSGPGIEQEAGNG
jgi:hypothetical protein